MTGMDVQLQKRSQLHWARKLWHVIGVLLIYWIYRVTPSWAAIPLVLTVWMIAVLGDYARIRIPAMNQIVLRLFRPFLRDYEVDHLAGTSALLTGVAILIAFFPRDIVSLSLLFLAFADPIASAVGIRFGKDKIFGHKSLQGTIAAFFVCATICGIYLSFSLETWPRVMLLSCLGGLIGALAEVIPIGNLDDNLTMPVVSAFLLWIVFQFVPFNWMSL